MSKNFITGAFQKMGEYPKNVKLMRNKKTGKTAGYAFVDFYDPVFVMHKLNGKHIPDTNPVSSNFIFYFPIHIHSGPMSQIRQLFYYLLNTSKFKHLIC